MKALTISDRMAILDPIPALNPQEMAQLKSNETNLSYTRIISPIDGVGPERLKVRQLFERADEANRAGARFEEVVIATNPTLEGEATAMYLAERLEPLVGSVTRIARGLPVGGDLEYADEVTLIRALQGRRAI